MNGVLLCRTGTYGIYGRRRQSAALRSKPGADRCRSMVSSSLRQSQVEPASMAGPL